MKPVLWVIFLLIVAASFIFVYHSAQNYLQEKSCCSECTLAFSQSPVAVGSEAAICGKFGSGQPLSANCSDYFEAHPKTVQACSFSK